VPFAAVAACASKVGPDVAAKTAVPGSSMRCETHSMRHFAAHWATMAHSSSMSHTETINYYFSYRNHQLLFFLPKPSTIIFLIDSTLRRSQNLFYLFPSVILRSSGGDLNAAAAKSRAPTVQLPTLPLRPNRPLPSLTNTLAARRHH
jgi:hypothetical protein